MHLVIEVNHKSEDARTVLSKYKFVFLHLHEYLAGEMRCVVRLSHYAAGMVDLACDLLECVYIGEICCGYIEA